MSAIMDPRVKPEDEEAEGAPRQLLFRARANLAVAAPFCGRKISVHRGADERLPDANSLPEKAHDQRKKIPATNGQKRQHGPEMPWQMTPSELCRGFSLEMSRQYQEDVLR